MWSTEGVHQKRKYRNQYPHPSPNSPAHDRPLFSVTLANIYIFFHRRHSP